MVSSTPAPTWPARYQANTVGIHETEHHSIWISTVDARKAYPPLRADAVLQKQYPKGIRKLDRGPRLFLSEAALRAELQLTRSKDALMFLAWLDKAVYYPAARKREGIPALQRMELDADSTDADDKELHVPVQKPLRESRVAKAAKPQQQRPDRTAGEGSSAVLLRMWRGQESLRRTVLTGGAVAFCWMLVILALLYAVTDQANYTGAYKLRQWGAVVLLALSPLGALGWSVALMRCGLLRHQAGGSMVTSLLAFVLGVCVLVQTVTVSLGLAGEWVSGWWQTVHDDLRVTEVLHDPHLGRIVLRGEIGFGSLAALEKAINTKPTLTLLEVESPGGFVVEGLAMARLIEKHKLDTVSLGECASACTLLLVAGQERYLGPETQVGFHRSWSYAGGFGTGWSRIDHTMADFYSARNTADAFIKTALDTPGYRLWFPTAGQMFDAGYATKRWDERKSGY